MYSSLDIDSGNDDARGFCAKVEDAFNDLLGYEVLGRLAPDAVTLIACRFVRLFAFGFLAVVLVVYLTSIGFSTAESGLIFTWTLVGDACVSLFCTSHADLFGRRRVLIWSSVLALATGLIFATQSNYWIILITAIIGVVSPSGNEIGPFMAIEISSISQIVRPEDRIRVLSWYNLFGSFATAFGALFCGFLVDYLQYSFAFSPASSYQAAMIVYAFLQVFLVIGFHFLGPSIEAETVTVREVNPIPLFLGLHKSKTIVIQLSLLFALDAFAGSFVLQSIISEWFTLSFNASASAIGTVLFVCNIVAGVSALFAAKLADVIGLVMTMVVTHLPSNVLLILVPLMPTETLAMLMIIARFSISQMDVPTRNAYVVGVVDENERSAAGGVTNIFRSLGAAIGPSLAGSLLLYPATQNNIFYWAGGLKIVYDILLLLSFRSVKSDDEKARDERAAVFAASASPIVENSALLKIKTERTVEI